MRIIGLWAMLMILLYALQTSLLTFINFDGFSANLMLLLTLSIAFLRGNKYGAFFGFMAGLLQDATSGSYFGLATFSYMTIGLIFGKFSVNLFRDQSLLPVISSIPALVIHFAITIGFLFLLDRQIDLVRFLREDFWPAAIMQVVLAYPVHRLVVELNEYSKKFR
ncbi:MAG: rod shape-determining protein MreD [Selenomonadaceae bacterium]|nr:rod shape-determining protein MreD [Selenomonadaceae bacterium]